MNDDYEDRHDQYEDEVELETEDESDPIIDMLQSALDGDYVNADKSFAAILNDRLADAMDQEKVRIADSVYNGEEPELYVDDEFEAGDADLDDDDISELDDDDIEYLDSLENDDEDED